MPTTNRLTQSIVLKFAVALALLHFLIAGCGKVENSDQNASAQFKVGGLVSGLKGSLTLRNNASDSLTIHADGAFSFPLSLADGADFQAMVVSQPSSQACEIRSGSGKIAGADYSGIRVECSDSTYSVGGSLSGLRAGATIVLKHGADVLSLTTNGDFQFPTTMSDGATYSAIIFTPAPFQNCAMAGGAGSISGANVTSIAVTCVNLTVTLSGTLSGMSPNGSLLLRNGASALTLNANGNFTFAAPVNQGAAYAVVVGANPADQVCTVANGSGTAASANITNVAVTCAAARLIGGTIAGLAGTEFVVLRNNGGNNLVGDTNGAFNFSSPVRQGAPYAVTVATAPTGKVCSIAKSTGVAGAADVSDIRVNCGVARTVSGTISGLTAGTSVVLQNNGINNLSKNANGAFSFTAPIAQGGTYLVSVLTQPAGLVCAVTNGSGTAGAANITNVAVDCVPARTVSATINGLVGSVGLRNNGLNPTVRNANGAFTFSIPVGQGRPYAVTISTQPATQTCSVVNGSGTAGTANISNVVVNCVTNP